ncbi:hypothetical protein ACOMHN_039137 [Nucella lapillus]
MKPISVLPQLLGIVIILSLLPSPTPAFFLEWGPDLEGPWCAQRPPGQDCCVGRDDYCAVPILGTECYCDIFCNDTSYDCCPDFWSHCHGVHRSTTTPRPTTLPPPRPTRPLDASSLQAAIHMTPTSTLVFRSDPGEKNPPKGNRPGVWFEECKNA